MIKTCIKYNLLYHAVFKIKNSNSLQSMLPFCKSISIQVVLKPGSADSPFPHCTLFFTFFLKWLVIFDVLKTNKMQIHSFLHKYIMSLTKFVHK